MEFRLDYAGGWGKYRTLYWKTSPAAAAAYDGPALPNVVAACKAPDGSYWAAQSWPQPLPDLGFTPWTPRAARWLEVSHWTGPVAQLETGIELGLQRPLPGASSAATRIAASRSTASARRAYGAPTDGFGRARSISTRTTRCTAGLAKRENSFVSHNPTGAFCYGFYLRPDQGRLQASGGPDRERGPGTGEKYRLFAEGPGVTPDVAVIVQGLHPFDRATPQDVALQQEQSATLQSYGDKSCRAGL